MPDLNKEAIENSFIFIRRDKPTSTCGEVRAITTQGQVISKIYTFPREGLEHVEELHTNYGDDLKGVYSTFNAIDKKSLGSRVTARDKDMAGISFIAVDIDPVKAKTDQSATDREKQFAKQLTSSLVNYLSIEGFGKPDLLVDSGNGYHIYYRTDILLKNKVIPSEFLKALNTVKSTAHAKIDTNVANPSRIMRIPGTYARKGENTEERPWRLSKIIEEGQL